MNAKKAMRAWVSHEPGGCDSLVLEEMPIPETRTGEILVRVEAVGVNYPDSLLLRGLYQVSPPHPLVPGSEFRGVVEEAGATETHLRRGDVVVGVCGWGALAEYIALPEERLVKIPDELPRAEAAAFLFTYATAYHALQDAGRLQRGETLLVLGAAGGVGSAAIDVATGLGANVIAATSTSAKLEYATKRGAMTGIVYEHELHGRDGQKSLSASLKELVPQGADVIFDPVGGLYTECALRVLARGGRHLVIGFTAGIPRVPLNLALLKSSHIIGVDWRTFVMEQPGANRKNVGTLLDLWRDHLIKPDVTEMFPFDAAPEAITRLESRQALGKIVVSIGER